MYRQLEKWDGTVQSLCLKSRRPNISPNKHTVSEQLALIESMYEAHGLYGNAEVYVKCIAKGCNRSFGSMCRHIRVKGLKPVKRKKKSYTRYENITGQYIGDKVQIDIKYVPSECIMFPFYGKRYYQLTAIDEYSRVRILSIIDEKSTYETGKFLQKLEDMFGFPIKTIQVDNGCEFVNDREITNRKSYIEEVALLKEYDLILHGRMERWKEATEKMKKFYMLIINFILKLN